MAKAKETEKPTQRLKINKYRVLKDFTGNDGLEHKQGDILNLTFWDAQPLINSDKLTSDLGEAGRESAE